MKLSKKEIEILNGHLLGDACLYKHKNCINVCLTIVRKSTDYEYLLWTKDNLQSIFKDCSIKEYSYFDVRTSKTYSSVSIRSKVNPVLTDIYNNWYRNGVKVVPRDLILTPLTLALWFADDGMVSKMSKYSLGVKLSTDGFALDDVFYLKSIMDYDKIHVYKNSKTKEQYNIRLHGNSAKKFFQDIDDLFPPLDRKSSLWRNASYDLHNKIIPHFCLKCGIHDNVYFYGFTDGQQMFYCKVCKISYYSLEHYTKKPKFLSYEEWSVLKPNFYKEENRSCSKCGLLLPCTDEYFYKAFHKNKDKQYLTRRCKKCINKKL